METILLPNLTSIINASDGSQQHCIYFPKEVSRISRNISIFSAVVCSLEFLAGITASGFVIWMKVYRLERTFRSVLSLHLFISGFLWSLFLLLNVVYFALGNNWPFGSFMCKLQNVVFHLNMFISSFILVLYSIDYFLVVMWPLKYNVYRRPHLASVEAYVSLLVAACISIPYVFFKTTYECHNTIRCSYRFDDTEITNFWKQGHKVTGVMAFIIGYCIPLMIIVSCFVITAVVYHQKKTSKYTPALKMIFTFQALFGVCWLPYHIVTLMKLSLLLSGQKNLDGVEMIQPITISLASLSCAVNPIIYAFVSPDFKKRLPKYRK